MKIIPKQLIKAIIFQFKKKDWFKNIFITHNAFGILHEGSHFNSHCNVNTPKVMYNTVETATKCADKLSIKNNCHYSVYKCAYCSEYHIGRNKDNRA